MLHHAAISVMWTAVMLEQLLKAPLAMEVTPLPIVTDIMLEQPEKA